MSGNPKITEDQIIANSSVLLSLVGTDASKAHKKRILKAAAFEKLESVVDTVAESTGGKVASKAPSGDDSYETFSGRNLYINNGISIEALLEMLKNDTKTANEGYKLYGTTAMLKAGFTKDETSGLMTHTGDALVTQEGSQIIASGANQALNLRIDAWKGLASGLSPVGMAAGSQLTMKGDVEEEQSKVDKLQNALDTEKEISQGEMHTNDTNGDSLDENGNQITPQTAEVKRAITALEDNGYDVTKGGNHFGSKRTEGKKFAVTKDTSFNGVDIDTGNETSVPVKEALAQATIGQRAKIRSNLQKRLNKAEGRLADSRVRLADKKQQVTNMGTQLVNGVSSLGDLQKGANAALIAQADAQKVVIKNMSDTETGLMQKQNEGIAAATKNQSSALDLLRQMYAQLGKRG
jgi:hypothetical protein